MWRAAGQHLNNRGDGRLCWLKADLMCPMMEHLSFRIGNQLVFLQVIDLAHQVHGPGSKEGLISKAEEAGATPCLLQMRRHADGTWHPEHAGWGLLNAETLVSFDPLVAATAEPVVLTDWEIHDFAIQVVRNHLEEKGRRLMGYCSDLHVDPSLWFVGDEGPEWVAIRGARFPATEPDQWPNLEKVWASSQPLAKAGNTAVVCVSHVDQDPSYVDRALPMLRGEALEADFSGLKQIASHKSDFSN